MQHIRMKKIELIEVLTIDPMYILQHLQADRLFTNREYSNISTVRQSSEETATAIVDKLINKGDQTCQRFMAVLEKPEVQETYPRLAQLFPHHKLQQDAHDKLQAPHPQNDEYKMTSEPRGLCLIFNIESFSRRSTRRGSQNDVDALTEVFGWLDFTVKTFKDKTAQEMRDLLKEFSKQPHGDCLVCCVLSHGNQQGIYGSDSEMLSYQELCQAFNGSSCPALVGKPKVFFIQACRGGLYQQAVGVQTDHSERLEADRTPNINLTLPEDADFLVGMATLHDYYSLRDTSTGSWFIQSLCRILKEFCPKGEDILRILTRVNKEVSAQGYRRDNQLVKQMPNPHFTLTKKLVFHVPGPAHSRNKTADVSDANKENFQPNNIRPQRKLKRPLPSEESIEIEERSLNDIISYPEQKRVHVMVKILAKKEKVRRMTRSRKSMYSVDYAVADKTRVMLMTVWGDDPLQVGQWWHVKEVSVRTFLAERYLTTTKDTTYSQVEDKGPTAPLETVEGEIVSMTPVTPTYQCPKGHRLENGDLSNKETFCQKCNAHYRNNYIIKQQIIKLTIDCQSGHNEYILDEHVMKDIFGAPHMPEQAEITEEIKKWDRAVVTLVGKQAIKVQQK